MDSSKLKKRNQTGFSLPEVMIVMTILLVVLTLVSSVFAFVLDMRDQESAKSEVLTTMQAAINVMSREISNSGYGLRGNGIMLDNSNQNQLHFRANVVNDDLKTNDAGEEVMYYFDSSIDSVVRYDRFAVPKTSIVINRVSNVTFKYFNYSDSSTTPTESTTPTKNTGKVQIILMVQLPNAKHQPENQHVTLTTEVNLRNSTYMLNQY